MTSILNFTRDQVVALCSDGLMNKASILHFDVCFALSQGLTQEKIAEKFGLSDSRVVRYIKERKCPDCRTIF